MLGIGQQAWLQSWSRVTCPKQRRYDTQEDHDIIIDRQTSWQKSGSSGHTAIASSTSLSKRHVDTVVAIDWLA